MGGETTRHEGETGGGGLPCRGRRVVDREVFWVDETSDSGRGFIPFNLPNQNDLSEGRKTILIKYFL